MFSSTEKVVILSGSIFGSIYLFSTSLNCLNDVLLRRNNFNREIYNENEVNKIIVINSVTMLFSGGLFGYFTYIATK